MSYSIDEINQMSQEEFVAAFGTVFEETPAIAHQAWKNRPFISADHIHQHMLKVVHEMDQKSQLTFIRSHPDLGSKAKMAEASVQEQAGAGLDRLTPEEYECFQQLNQAYRDKFSFPFIVAVKNHTKDSILEAFKHRLNNPLDMEIQQALSEIAQITQLRLSTLVK
ncbi:MAG TPA: 2-oxo-4-hydroxy-4-carboxy-5-ureidoimidazoline decarboxylase [Trichocoleus sp.]|jgi:2-oxo-4-hydroxy-4-carboxy-5-ureidoimidazoline decarboxylase